MNVTIKDVAKAAGVSVATVSRVLNGSSNVSQEAIKNVNETIKALNYKPNFLGRNLRKCETNKILVVQPTSDHSLYSKIITGIQETALLSGYDIITAFSNNTPDAELRQLNMLYNRTVDGVVLLGTSLDGESLNAIAENYNVALCCESVIGANVLTVVVDDEQGGYDAVSALIKKGHTKIAMISAGTVSSSSIGREQGYIRALKENGIAVRDEYIYHGSYEYETAHEAMEQFLALDEKPTAIFAVSDSLAVGAIREAANHGLTVGKDLMVMGFDDIVWSERFIPSISSIAQPCAEMGRLVAEKLIGNIKSGNNDTCRYSLGHKIVLRESTGD